MAISAKTKLVWDPERLVYLYNGRADSPVDPRDIRKWIDRMIEASGENLLRLGNQVREGKLSVAKWQTLAAKEIKNLHTSTFIIASGGKDQVGFSGYARLGQTMQFQLEHLRDFARDIPRRVDERDGRIPSRLQSYATAAFGTYENEKLDKAINFGLSIARRQTAHGSESCDVCLEAEDLGWVDINEVRRIGDSPCGARCNCIIETEIVQPGRAATERVVRLWPIACAHCQTKRIEHRRAA